MPPPSVPAITRRYQRLSTNDLRLIVRLRWGSENPALDIPAIMSVQQIADKLHIPLSTVGKIVSTFFMKGYDGYKRTYERWKMLPPQM